jgi:hypothetical protein
MILPMDCDKNNLSGYRILPNEEYSYHISIGCGSSRVKKRRYFKLGFKWQKPKERVFVAQIKHPSTWQNDYCIDSMLNPLTLGNDTIIWTTTKITF